MTEEGSMYDHLIDAVCRLRGTQVSPARARHVAQNTKLVLVVHM